MPPVCEKGPSFPGSRRVFLSCPGAGKRWPSGMCIKTSASCLWRPVFHHHGRGHGPRFMISSLCGPLAWKKWVGTRKRLSGLSTCLWKPTWGMIVFWENRLLSATDGGDVFRISLWYLETRYPEIIPNWRGDSDETTDSPITWQNFSSVVSSIQKNFSKIRLLLPIGIPLNCCSNTVRTSKHTRGVGLPVSLLTSDLITDFCQWLETERGCCILPEIRRLAAIHSFFHYLQRWRTLWTVSFPKSDVHSH